MPVWLTAALAVLGSVTGVLSLAISTLNYRRDQARIAFEIEFNDAGRAKMMTTVRLANIGRRPVHVSRVGLCRTRWWRLGTMARSTWFKFAVEPGYGTTTLEEGGEAWSLGVSQEADRFVDVTKNGGHLRVFATVAGKTIRSKAFKIPPVIVPD
jgi:hypothetical protein